MFTPATLFGKLERCDYIKCDVEGYEIHIIPQLGFLLSKHQPIIQIEIEPANRKAIISFLADYTYSAYCLEGEQLMPVGKDPEDIFGDFFFIPQNKMKLAAPYVANV
jgi:hypothetical protein